MNKILCHTRHVTLERRQGPSGLGYYTVTFMDNNGNELGWNLYNDMDRAYRACVDHIRRMSICR